MKAIAATVILCALPAVTSSIYAQTWTPTGAPNEIWKSVACSADGSKLVAVVESVPYSQAIYTSTNSGGTWTSNNVPAVEWWSVASSADGTKLVAAAYAGGSGLFTSTNSGTTWTSNNVPAAGWFSVASSADGSRFVAVAGGEQAQGPIYTSTNSGANWASNAVSPNYWCSVASSADGTKLVALAESTAYYTSADSGNTWVSNGIPSAQWTAVSSSADGTKLVAAVLISGAHYLFTSTNSGASWTTNKAPVSRTASVASSADGNTLIAVEESRVWLSTDSGTTWVSNNLTGFWLGAAMSEDGKKVFGANAGSPGGIWLLQTTPSPQLNLFSSNGNLNISWLVPSTNMILEESPGLVNWTTLTNQPALDYTNLQEQLTLPLTNCASFFRLISQ